MKANIIKDKKNSFGEENKILYKKQIIIYYSFIYINVIIII